jgi:hypothetical protein
MTFGEIRSERQTMTLGLFDSDDDDCVLARSFACGSSN